MAGAMIFLLHHPSLSAPIPREFSRNLFGALIFLAHHREQPNRDRLNPQWFCAGARKSLARTGPTPHAP